MERQFAEWFGHIEGLAVFELGRVWNGISLALMSVIGLYMFTKPALTEILLLSLVWIFLYMGAASINDVHDSAADKINMPYRPIPSGRITPREAEIIAAFMYLLGNAIAYLFFGTQILILGLIFTILSLIYSVPPYRVAGRGFVAQVKLSFLSIFLPFYSGAVYTLQKFEIPSKELLAVLSMTILYIFLAITKDYKDIDGDKKEGKYTFLLRVGYERAIHVSLIGTLIFYPLTMYLFYTIFNKISLIVLMSFPFIATLYEQKLILDKKIANEERVFTRIRLFLLCIILLLLSSLILHTTYANLFDLIP